MPKQPMISRLELARVITQASLFAERRGHLPILNAVRLEASGTHLIAAATDRFSLGAASAEYEGTPFAITLPMSAADLILAACKLDRRDSRTDLVDLRVTPKGTLLHVTINETVVTVPTFRPTDYAYPDWRKLVSPSSAAVDPVSGMLAANPKYLARLAKVGHDAKFYMRGPSKPITARIGDHFVAVIMPIRLGDDDVWALPGWLETPTATTVKAVA